MIALSVFSNIYYKYWKKCVHVTAIYTNRTNHNKVALDNINLIPEANLDAIAEQKPILY